MVLEWTSPIDSVEFMPPLRPRSKLKTGKLSKVDCAEIRLRCGKFDKELGSKSNLGDTEMVLGSWLLYRDLLRREVKEIEMPYFVCPQISQNISDQTITEEVREHATQILRGYWRSRGLVGVPVFAGGHWTLLVLRRSGPKESEVVKVKYYDSLKDGKEGDGSEACKTAAKIIMQALKLEIQLPGRCNAAFQGDTCSCGLFVLWYWEGHVRQYLGEGWSIDRPEAKSITLLRNRLAGYIQVLIKEFVAADAGPAKKKKKANAEVLDILDIEEVSVLAAVPELSKVEDLMAALKDRAELARLAPAKEFYGCSKCRWSRGGCISYKCNPVKFLAHKEKFPERYGKDVKELKADVAKKLTDKELTDMVTGEGSSAASSSKAGL